MSAPAAARATCTSRRLTVFLPGSKTQTAGLRSFSYSADSGMSTEAGAAESVKNTRVVMPILTA